MSNLRNLIVFGGEGGGTPPEPPTLIEKTVTSNGVYNASDDNADGYSKVTANVPNTYTQSDEGKVVSNGALVAQTAYPTTITANSIYDTTLYNSVTVDVQPPAPLQPTISGATIYDYDGTVIATYTPEEFVALTEYPAHPTHEYLTADGYNWTLANAKEYSAKYGYVEVGAQYRVTDGKTRLFITLSDGRLEPQLGLGINGSVDVDWGDGSAHDTMTGSAVGTTVYQVHKYAQAGDYIITLTVTGNMQFNGTNGYADILGKQGGDSASVNCVYLSSLHAIYIGSDVTINSNAFMSCYYLEYVVIPNANIQIFPQAAFSGTRLKEVVVPQNVAGFANSTFASASVFHITNAQSNSRGIRNLVFTSASNLNRFIFANGATGTGVECFRYASRMTLVVFPYGFLSIGARAFEGNLSLAMIVLPETITIIDAQAFQNCNGLGYIKFKGTTTIPTITNVNAWSGIPSDCYILVPFDYLDDYINTTNMPDDSTYLYLCYATYADGATLPTVDGDGYALTWYASREDARAQTNPITVGNGKEIYARGVEP